MMRSRIPFFCVFPSSFPGCDIWSNYKSLVVDTMIQILVRTSFSRSVSFVMMGFVSFWMRYVWSLPSHVSGCVLEDDGVNGLSLFDYCCISY